MLAVIITYYNVLQLASYTIYSYDLLIEQYKQEEVPSTT